MADCSEIHSAANSAANSVAVTARHLVALTEIPSAGCSMPQTAAQMAERWDFATAASMDDCSDASMVDHSEIHSAENSTANSVAATAGSWADLMVMLLVEHSAQVLAV